MQEFNSDQNWSMPAVVNWPLMSKLLPTSILKMKFSIFSLCLIRVSSMELLIFPLREKIFNFSMHSSGCFNIFTQINFVCVGAKAPGFWSKSSNSLL